MTSKLITLSRESIMGLLIVMSSFIIFEPAISFGNQFLVSQTINAELSFSTNASNVVMAPSIGGLTGGTSNGGTQFAIVSSNSTGYTVTAQSGTADGRMVGNASSTNSIPGYVTSIAGVPDYNFTVPLNSARFGYAISASSTGDIVPNFKWTGATCGGAGTNSDITHCWIAATSTTYTVINRSTPTGSSPATSTIAFRAQINANPSPMIPNDTYTSTTTLTAVAN